ncbi:hypothetical protein [Sinobaca sp. H24]|uniref:hypothetical protein n=1 Tax=Sinobaca sp. H24 TaxID=2923376 RepID=UPI00207B0C2E|nr:hypothetical protein [Sinobaca sp. H24]
MFKNVMYLSGVVLIATACAQGENNEEEAAANIVDHAMEVHRNASSYHEEMLTASDDMEGESTTKTWVYQEDDITSYRIEDESENRIIANDNGAMYEYFENDNENYQYDADPEKRTQNQERFVSTLESLKEQGDVRFEGEEQIEGVTADKIVFDGEQTIEMWFDQETNYRIQEKSITSDGGETTSLITDYELDIEYDESFYSLKDVIDDDTAIIEEDPEA